MEWKDLKIDPNYEKVLPKLSGEEYEALKASIIANGLLMPLIVNGKGIILDGHNRFHIAEELKFSPTLKIELVDFLDATEEKAFVISVNLQRRNLNAFQKAEMGMVLLKVETELAKRRRTSLSSSEDKDIHDRSATGIVAKNIGISHATFERAKKVIEDAPEKLKELCRKESVTINAGYGITKAFDDVPEANKKALLTKIEDGALDPRQVIGIVTETKAIKAKLEGEDEEIQKKADTLFKDQYYTENLDSKKAIWELEEMAGDSHSLVPREFPIEKFSTQEEAQKWAVERNGVCLGKIQKWSLKVDPIKEKELKEEEEQ